MTAKPMFMLKIKNAALYMLLSIYTFLMLHPVLQGLLCGATNHLVKSVYTQMLYVCLLGKHKINHTEYYSYEWLSMFTK